jgi:hypothetical protein
VCTRAPQEASGGPTWIPEEAPGGPRIVSVVCVMCALCGACFLCVVGVVCVCYVCLACDVLGVICVSVCACSSEAPGGPRRPQAASAGPGELQEAPRRGLGYQKVQKAPGGPRRFQEAPRRLRGGVWGSILGGCLRRNRHSLRIGVKIIEITMCF